MANGNKPRYRYRWRVGLWQLQNEEQVSLKWPYWWLHEIVT